MHVFGVWEDGGAPTHTWAGHANWAQKNPWPPGNSMQNLLLHCTTMLPLIQFLLYLKLT